MSDSIARLPVRRVPCPVIAGEKAGFSDGIASPTSPLEFKTRSPKKCKNLDPERVGLGIVAALEKSGGIQTKFAGKIASIEGLDAALTPSFRDMESKETFTRVTYHGSESSVIRVYRNGADGRAYNQTEFYIIGSNKEVPSSTSFRNSSPLSAGENCAFPGPDFLSACHLCRKGLHGRDIYMYRGEKAFCSEECRQSQIISDDIRIKYRSGNSEASDMLVSAFAQTIGSSFQASQPNVARSFRYAC